MAKITYTDKTIGSKWTATDANEVKESVNDIYDIELPLTLHTTGNETKSGNLTLNKTPSINTGVALVAPYFSSITGGITYSNDAGTTEAIMISHQFRIRQDGAINAIELYTANKTNLTSFKVRIYRANGSNYDLIGESEDISASLSSSGSSLITLIKPITGVLQGDYYGFISTQSGAWDGLRVFDSASESLVNTFIRKSTNGAAFANTSQALSMRIFMENPSIILLGSSITEGLYTNTSFLHSDVSLFNESVYWGDMLALKLGFKYQNMGIGGSSSSMILARVQADVIDNKPNYVTLQGTVNDIIAGIPAATTIANFDTIINSCVTNGITPIVLPILPYNGDTNANYQKRDAINAGIKASALSRGAIFIDGIDQALGVFKVGGDVGNLWNLNPLYNTDNYHLNLSGSTVLTNTIFNVIRSSVLSGALISNTIISENITVKNLESSTTDLYYPLANSTGSIEKGQITKSAVETTKFNGSYNFRINTNTTLTEVVGGSQPGIGINYVNNLSIHPAGSPSETPLPNTGFRLMYALSDTLYRSAIAIDNLPTSDTGMLRLMAREGNVNIGTGSFDVSAKLVVFGSIKATSFIGALNRTGGLNETFDGVKSATNTGTTQLNGIQLTNNGTTGSARSLNIDNTASGTGARMSNSSTGIGLLVPNTGAGNGIQASNISTGNGVFIDNQSTGIGALINSATGSTGDLLRFAKNSVVTAKVDQNGIVTAPQYNVSALNIAPPTSTSTGTLGEIRITATAIYVCTATNTWVKATLATF